MSNALPPAYASIEEMGGYDSLPADIKAQLPLAPLPASVQAKAQEAMATEMAKPETQTKLMQEVAALSDSVAKVDAAFERVRVGLGNVDNNDYKDKNDVPIAKFQPTWEGFQKRWTTLLWGSRDAATGTEAYINDFIYVILPEIEKIKDEKELPGARVNLDSFIKREDPFGKKLNSQETVNAAQKFSQDFTDLRRDLEAFKASFDDFAKDKELELTQDILDKESEITTLKAEIASCRTLIAAMGIALGVTIFSTGAGAVAAVAGLGPIGPAVAIGVVIVGVIAALAELSTLIAYVVKLNEYQKDLTRAEADLVSLQAQLKDLKALKALLATQKADIEDIASRLDRFSAIWGFVRHDAQLIQAGMDTAATDEGNLSAFQTRVSLIKTSYTQLGGALADYATRVGTPPAQ